MSLPPDLVLRRAELDDGAGVLALLDACQATFADWLPAGWRPPEVAGQWPDRYLDDASWSRAGFDAQSVLVAFVSFRPGEDDFAHLALLLVHPSRWGEGIASALLALAESELRARGYAGVRLRTPDGAPAERLYERHGWTRTALRDWHPWLALAMVGYEKRLS